MDMNDLKALGITEEELANRVVDAIVDRMLVTHSAGDGERDYTRDSEFHGKIADHIAVRIDAAVKDMADKVILPNVETFIENFKLKETNRWGEKAGRELTFTEYLVERAEHWINEPVDFEGKPKGRDAYNSWTQRGTRLALMIDKHIHYHIDGALKQALTDMNTKVGTAIAETVKASLTTVLKEIKVDVKTR